MLKFIVNLQVNLLSVRTIPRPPYKNQQCVLSNSLWQCCSYYGSSTSPDPVCNQCVNTNTGQSYSRECLVDGRENGDPCNFIDCLGYKIGKKNHICEDGIDELNGYNSFFDYIMACVQICNDDSSCTNINYRDDQLKQCTFSKGCLQETEINIDPNNPLFVGNFQKEKAPFILGIEEYYYIKKYTGGNCDNIHVMGGIIQQQNFKSVDMCMMKCKKTPTCVEFSTKEISLTDFECWFENGACEYGDDMDQIVQYQRITPYNQLVMHDSSDCNDQNGSTISSFQFQTEVTLQACSQTCYNLAANCIHMAFYSDSADISLNECRIYNQKCYKSLTQKPNWTLFMPYENCKDQTMFSSDLTFQNIIKPYGDLNLNVLQMNNLFNQAETNCGINRCELKSPGGCTLAYSGTHLIPSQTDQFVYTAISLENVAGWQETVCVKCYNGFQIIKFDDINVIQDPCPEMVLKSPQATNDFQRFY